MIAVGYIIFNKPEFFRLPLVNNNDIFFISPIRAIILET